jgi:predicted nucleic acid-binding protein
MTVLVDTNILLRVLQPNHNLYATAKRAVQILRDRNQTLFVTAQNVVEFWAVCTRPSESNGLGFTPVQTRAELDTIKNLFILLPEPPLLAVWEKLVVRHNVSGKNTHDARLVAAMLIHDIESILLFNAEDFNRYNEISVLDPELMARS